MARSREEEAMGGKPNKGTPKDKRLTENKPKGGKKGGGKRVKGS
jgi:hypothetical protein